MLAHQSAAAQHLRAPLVRLRLASASLLVLGGLMVTALAGPPAAGALPGQLVWASTFHGLVAGSDQISSVAPGPGGTMYAAGTTGWGTATGDFLILRYRAGQAPGGPILWTTRWDNLRARLGDSAKAVFADRAGDAIAVGETYNASGGLDLAVVKVSPVGQILWVTIIDGFYDDHFGGAGLDARGNVFVADQVQRDPATSEWWVAKVQGSTGKILWRSGYQGLNGTGAPTSLAVSAAGNAYAAGWVAAPGGAPQPAVVEWSGAGTVVWARRLTHSAPAPLTDTTARVAVHGTQLYLAAQWTGTAGWKVPVVARYTLGGKRLWVRSWPGIKAAKGTEVGALAVDGFGDPVVGGISRTSTDYGKGYVASWTPGGRQRWVRTYWVGTPGAQEAHVDALTADARGRVWAGGRIALIPGNSDAWTLALSPTGRIRWQQTYDGAGHGADRISAIALWGRNAVFAGGLADSGSGQDVLAERVLK